MIVLPWPFLLVSHLQHDLFWWPLPSERKEAHKVFADQQAPLNNIPTGSKQAILLLRKHQLQDFYIPRICKSPVYQRIVEAALPIRFSKRSVNLLILNSCIPTPQNCQLVDSAAGGKIQLAICR